MISLESPPPKKKIYNPQIKIASAHIHTPRNNPAKFQKYPMDTLGAVADKRPLYMYMKENGFGGNPPPKWKDSQIKIASAHIHILRNNPAKFHNNPMDSLGEVADFERTDGRDGRTRVT